MHVDMKITVNQKIKKRVTIYTGEPATLRVNDTGRFLVTADGQSFFWLGDTIWALFSRLTRAMREPWSVN